MDMTRLEFLTVIKSLLLLLEADKKDEVIAMLKDLIEEAKK